MAVDPNDVMLMARTMWGENNNATPDEYAAIANVMRNRMLAGGYSGGASPQLGGGMASVVLAPHQFQAWDNPKAKNYPMNAPLRSPAFQSAYHIAADVLSGQNEDPTHGAVYYYNPKAPGQKTPDWAKGREGQQIGSHKFYGPLSAPEADWGEGLMPKAPPPELAQSAATDGVIPSGDDNSDWGAHIDAAPEPPPQQQPTTVAESVEQSRKQGQGIAQTVQGAAQTLIRQHPTAARIFGGLAAANTGIPLAGAAAMGVNALPLWAQGFGGYMAYKAGVPEAARSLFGLLREALP